MEENNQESVTVRKVKDGFLCVVDSKEIRRNSGDDGLRLFTGAGAEGNMIANLAAWNLPVKPETEEIKQLIAAADPSISLV